MVHEGVGADGILTVEQAAAFGDVSHVARGAANGVHHQSRVRVHANVGLQRTAWECRTGPEEGLGLCRRQVEANFSEDPAYP